MKKQATAATNDEYAYSSAPAPLALRRCLATVLAPLLLFLAAALSFPSSFRLLLAGGAVPTNRATNRDVHTTNKDSSAVAGRVGFATGFRAIDARSAAGSRDA